MPGETSIGWATHSWNPGVGCIHVSEGCDNCYADFLHTQRFETFKAHHGRWPDSVKYMPRQYGRPFSEIQLFENRLDWPRTLSKPAIIFVNSMSDVYAFKAEEIKRAWKVMVECPHHLFLVLTKRILSLRFKEMIGEVEWTDNIGLGVSCELDKYTNRIVALRDSPAKLKFVSFEPLLGPCPTANLDGIDWAIVGAESGPREKIRPMEAPWVRELRDKALDVGASFFYKQEVSPSGRKNESPLLDGREWKQFPDRARKVLEARGSLVTLWDEEVTA